MRLVLLIMLIAFPIAEITVLVKLFSHYGIWVLFYLVVVAMLGLQLIKEEKLLFSGKMMQGLTQGGSPIKAIFGSARNIIAGVLLLIPGVFTDVIATIILLIPVREKQQQSSGSQQQTYEKTFQQERQQQNHSQQKKEDFDVIEGEFHRED